MRPSKIAKEDIGEDGDMVSLELAYATTLTEPMTMAVDMGGEKRELELISGHVGSSV